MDFFEYSLEDGALWRVEAGREVAAAFDLGQAEAAVCAALPRWHRALSSQGQAWQVVCRRYAVNPAFGVEAVEELEPWALPRIAETFGIPQAEAERLVEAAREFWRRFEAARQRAEPGAPSGPPRGLAALEMSDEEAAALARSYGFDTSEIQEVRYVARRIEELDAALDSPQTRPSAQSLIQQEVALVFALDPSIAKLRVEIRGAGSSSTKTLEERLLRLIKARAEAQKGIDETLKTLGINEVQTGTLRSRASVQGTLSALLDAVREYHARGDTALVDGVHTALEVEILTTEFTIRPIQYRPDLVAMLSEATQLRNLFDPEWEPPALARKAVQRLRRGFRDGVALVRDELGEPITELDEESAGEAVERAVREGTRGFAATGMESALSRPAATAVPSESMAQRPRGRGKQLWDY